MIGTNERHPTVIYNNDRCNCKVDAEPINVGYAGDGRPDSDTYDLTLGVPFKQVQRSTQFFGAEISMTLKILFSSLAIPVAYIFCFGSLGVHRESALPSLLPRRDSGSCVNPSGFAEDFYAELPQLTSRQSFRLRRIFTLNCRS